MHARTTTVQATPSSVDAGITYLRDAVMPALLRMSGCVGFSALADRQSGLCIATTSWDSERAMRASAKAVEAVRDEGTQAFQGSVVGVQEWEIALLHREHHARAGTCVRVTWTKGAPATVDAGLEQMKKLALPSLQKQDGFCSMSVLVDRAAGRMSVAAAYDSQLDMVAARGTGEQLRTRIAEELGAEIEDVHEFELVIAHLRVPERV